jgi:outer membrane protein assembly factor BamB
VRKIEPLFIGLGGHVVAIDRASGEELWRCKLKRSSFVTLSMDALSIYAGSAGVLYCIDKTSGQIRWQNPLPGLGMGVIAFEGDTTSTMAALAAAQAAAAAAAAS